MLTYFIAVLIVKKKISIEYQGKILKCSSCSACMRTADVDLNASCEVNVMISDSVLTMCMFTNAIKTILSWSGKALCGVTEQDIESAVLDVEEEIKLTFNAKKTKILDLQKNIDFIEQDD